VTPSQPPAKGVASIGNETEHDSHVALNRALPGFYPPQGGDLGVKAS